jgi:hypothetical protein
MHGPAARTFGQGFLPERSADEPVVRAELAFQQQSALLAVLALDGGDQSRHPDRAGPVRRQVSGGDDDRADRAAGELERSGRMPPGADMPSTGPATGFGNVFVVTGARSYGEGLAASTRGSTQTTSP